MNTQTIAGRSFALFVATMTTIALLTFIEVPVEKAALAPTILPAAPHLTLPDDDAPCRYLKTETPEARPCLSRRPRPARAARA